MSTVTALQARGVCNFNTPLGDVGAANSEPGSPVAGSVRLNFEDTQITASAAITVDSTSIIYAGYTNDSGNYFVGAVSIPLSGYSCTKFTSFFVFFKPMQFYITATSFLLTHGNSFYTRVMSSHVRQLQWESGLDYIYVATESAVSVPFLFFYTAFPQQCMLQCM